MSASDPAKLTVYFDGKCPVCSREIAAYRRQAGASAIAWVDATNCPTDGLGAGLTRDRAMARLHVRRADGELVSGALAFTTLWRHLPRFAWAGRLMGRAPLLPMLEAGYRLSLVIRRAWRRSPA